MQAIDCGGGRRKVGKRRSDEQQGGQTMVALAVCDCNLLTLVHVIPGRSDLTQLAARR